MITTLGGGVGAAKFLSGLNQIVKPEELNIIVNTGDDVELYGLYISPDIDITIYTLAGFVNKKKGWGIKNDKFDTLKMLKKYGLETWFQLGNKDLATHIYRTWLLKKGLKISEVTEKIRNSFGLKMNIYPMSNNKIQTKIVTPKRIMHFEEYLIKRKCKDKVLDVKFEGIEKSNPTEGIIESILESDLIILCPSNPIVSIGPIVSVPGIKDALIETKANIIGISPIIKGSTIKGPADKLMRDLGYEFSCYGVTLLYKDFLDKFVIDNLDINEKKRIEKNGIKVVTTNTIMKSKRDKIKLAKLVQKFGNKK